MPAVSAPPATIRAAFFDFGGVILSSPFEAFNAFNHAQFTTVDTNVNNVVTDPVTGAIDPLRSSFGKYTATREARVIQLAARINF